MTTAPLDQHIEALTPTSIIPPKIPTVAESSFSHAPPVPDDASNYRYVFDTAWHLLGKCGNEINPYCEALNENDLDGFWTFLLNGRIASISDIHAHTGETPAFVNPSDGRLILRGSYRDHIHHLLTRAGVHGVMVGVGLAWQNTYMPGAGADNGDFAGTINEDNIRDYIQQVVNNFGHLGAIDHWIIGGDAGTNNTVENRLIWEIAIDELDELGDDRPIVWHSPTYEFPPNGWFNAGYQELGGRTPRS